MSPFQRPRSPHWYIRPTVTIPGRGAVRLTARSTGQRSKQVAAAMERTVQELPLMGYADLVEELEAGTVSVAELHSAKLAGRLDWLRQGKQDPLLDDAVAQLPAQSDFRYELGVQNLLRLVAQVRKARGQHGRARLSWLLDPRNAQAVLEAREAEGQKRNSVRRCEFMALSILLTHAVGRERRDRVFRQLDFAKANDERDVFLRPEEIRRLLNEAGDPLFREALILAISSGIDSTPLRRIVPADFDDPALLVRDTKNASRKRTIELGDAGAAALRRAIVLSGAGLRERVWPWTHAQLFGRFAAAAERAGLREPGSGDERLRWKDLRAVFATYYLLGGGNPRDLQRIMGHKRLDTTLRYVKRLPMGQAQRMTAAEQRAGLGVLFEAVA